MAFYLWARCLETAYCLRCCRLATVFVRISVISNRCEVISVLIPLTRCGDHFEFARYRARQNGSDVTIALPDPCLFEAFAGKLRQAIYIYTIPEL
jgi:hypothetical protein